MQMLLFLVEIRFEVETSLISFENITCSNRRITKFVMNLNLSTKFKKQLNIWGNILRECHVVCIEKGKKGENL